MLHRSKKKQGKYVQNNNDRSLDVIAYDNAGISRNELWTDSNIVKSLVRVCDTYTKTRRLFFLCKFWGVLVFPRFDNLGN